MKKTLGILLTVTASFALIGCVAVPKTTATLDLKAGTAKITSPKDGNLQGLHVIYNGTNGTTTVDLGASGYNNSPGVISSTAAGQGLITSAFGGVIDGLVAKALQAYLGQLPTASTAPTTPTAIPAGAITPAQASGNGVVWLPVESLNSTTQPPTGWRMADNFYGPFCLSGNTNKCFIAIVPVKP